MASTSYDGASIKSILQKVPSIRSPEEIELIVMRVLKLMLPSSLTSDIITSYAEAVYLEVHDARTVLCLQEESIDKFHCILRGQVTLYSDCTTDSTTSSASKSLKQGGGGGAKRRLRNYGVEIDVLSRGQFFGEYFCMSTSDYKSPVTIVTSEYTELLTISKTSFQVILFKYFTSQLLEKATFLYTNYNMIKYLDISRMAHLCGISRLKIFKYNDVIVRQNSLVDNVYLIKDGLVKLSFDEKKLNIGVIKSKIHPPIGLLSQILKNDSSSRVSSGIASTGNSAIANNRNKKNKIRHQRKTLIDIYAEREQTLRRYGYREINYLKETLLCVLTTGGVVGGIEALGGIRQNLFTATVDSSTATVYKLNVSHFNSIFSLQSCPEQVEEEILKRLLEHVQHWRERFEGRKIELFDVMVQLFDQKLQELEISRLMQDTDVTTAADQPKISIRPRPHHYRRPDNLPRLIKDYICR